MGMNTPNQAQMIDTITMIPYPKIWIEHSPLELELDLPWAEFLGSYSPSKKAIKVVSVIRPTMSKVHLRLNFLW